MKKTFAILLTILMLFAQAQGALRENVVKAGSTPIWPMFHYNAQHTGQCPYDTSNNNGTLKWKFQTGGWVYSSPAIASDGTVYVGSDDNYLYAIGGGVVSPDFSISVTPSSQSVTPGSSTTYTVTLTSLNGFNNSVSLSISSVLPSGVTALFTPTSVTPTTSGATSTLTISTSSSTPAGSSTITINASGGGVTHSTQVVLEVVQIPIVYRPDHDGWGFQNYDPGEFTWEMFKQFFGTEHVEYNNGQRMPDAEAFYKKEYEKMGGMCFGMSGASTINFLHLDQTNAGSFALPFIYKPFLVKDSNQVVNSIKYYQGTQKGLEFWQFYSANIKKSPVEDYNEIKEKVSQGIPVVVGILYAFSVCKKDFSGAHALVAYKVEEVSPDKAYVYVYDPNYPGDTSRKIEFNLSENRWDYQFSSLLSWLWKVPHIWSGVNGDSKMVVMTDDSIFTHKGRAPWEYGKVLAIEGDLATPLLTDTQGNHYGYVGNQFVNDIPGLIEFTPIVSDTSNTFSQTVFVPNNTTLASVYIYGTGEGAGNFSLINKNSTFDFVNVPVTSNTVDRIDIVQDGTSLTYTTNDVNKEYEARLIRGFDNKSIIADINTSISQNDNVALKLDSKNEFVYKNSGGTKTYSLVLEQVGQNSGSFSCTNLIIRNNETHIIKVDNWDNLDATNVVLEIDKNSDGIIDEIKTLQKSTITASAGFGGTITPSGTVTVNYGSSQTFTIKADPKFMIARVLVDGSPIRITNP
ncbi:PQQ-binding-like beta-propeller repeat protein, partial [Caldisericum sp.]|uniref:PQQ-binding-like beta-propeller repeat protein n=1 Tax=Caldisericum sp. TaxID=2499687 RepID=UPI003D14EE95